MPLIPGKSDKVVSENIGELHQGQTYASTREKEGAKMANKQAIAIALRKAGKAKDQKKRSFKR
jgi:hypothetical protein